MGLPQQARRYIKASHQQQMAILTLQIGNLSSTIEFKKATF